MRGRGEARLHSRLERWTLQPDGADFETHTSHLMPVMWQFAFAIAGLATSWPADEGEVDTEPALRLKSAEFWKTFSGSVTRSSSVTVSEFLLLPTVVLAHAFAALGALVLGSYQLWAVKGSPGHRVLGYIWCSLMLAVAVSSYWINDIRQFGSFSLIHLLALLTVIGVPVAILAARKGNITQHRNWMKGMYIGGLIVAGIFTLAPGRVLGRLLIGW